MIRFVKGDIFKSEAEVLVNPVNCVGIAGKGLALTFKEKYPQNFQEYQKACAQGLVKIGTLTRWPTNEFQTNFIISFPTKKHWRENSKYEYIEAGLETLKSHILESGLQSIAIPALGCGLGGLSWPRVKQQIESNLGDLIGVDIIVYEP